jgi:hypothetical protein
MEQLEFDFMKQLTDSEREALLQEIRILREEVECLKLELSSYREKENALLW